MTMRLQALFAASVASRKRWCWKAMSANVLLCSSRDSTHFLRSSFSLQIAFISERIDVSKSVISRLSSSAKGLASAAPFS